MVLAFWVTLTLEDATVDTATDLFWNIDDAFLSWYDSRVLRLIPNNYPQQISAVKHGPSFPVFNPSMEDSQIEARRWDLLDEFPDVLVDPHEFDKGAKLVTVVRPLMKICLRPNAQPFARYTPALDASGNTAPPSTRRNSRLVYEAPTSAVAL